MTIRNSKTVLLGAVAAGLMSWQPANAGFSQGDSVTMGGQSTFRLARAYGSTAAHRAWLTQDALDNALVLATDRSPTAVTVARENGAVIITLDGRRIATVDANSAREADLTVDALAQQWARSIMNFLADQSRTDAYIATLRNNNAVQASVALLERRMYAPAGLTFPITLSTLINTATAKAGDVVEATIDRDVPMGHYVIPAGSLVIGEIVEPEPNNFSLRFHSLRTAHGTLLPIDAIVVQTLAVETRAAHLVCTYAIPSGMANDVPQVAGRIPAGIGIGTQEGTTTSNVLVFHNGTGSLAIGRPMFLQLETVTSVAVVMRNMPM